MRDNTTKKIVRISVRGDGTQSNGLSQLASISDDGRRVVFESDATNFTPDDTNGQTDIYIHDRDADHNGIFDEPGTTFTALLSYTSTFTAASNGRSTDARIFGNGDGAVYQSTAALVPEDTNGQTDVYSTSIGALVPVTSLVSKAAGVPGNGSSERPSVNLDGTVVAFGTLASNLVTGDTNGALDAVIWDSHSNPPTLTLATGTVVGDSGSGAPDVSHDALGRFVVFVSSATNLVVPKTNATVEAYVLDRSTGVISAESRTEFGESPNGDVFDPSISADGARVSYESVASNLTPDANVLTDILVRDRPSGLTEIASTDKNLTPANGTSTRSALSADGRYVAFNSDATNLVTPDANGVFDVFTRAAIVPQIYTVTRADLVFPLGHVESAPRLHWGTNTVHVNGQGFAPDATVDLGAGITIGNVQVSPTDITFVATVPNGTAAAKRNLIVDNSPSAAFGGRGGTQLCAACVSIQRWATAPDPIVGGQYIDLFSNGEFTSATLVRGFTTIFLTPDVLLLINQPLSSGDHDLVLDQTTSGTVTCSGCLHVQ